MPLCNCTCAYSMCMDNGCWSAGRAGLADNCSWAQKLFCFMWCLFMGWSSQQAKQRRWAAFCSSTEPPLGNWLRYDGSSACVLMHVLDCIGFVSCFVTPILRMCTWTARACHRAPLDCQLWSLLLTIDLEGPPLFVSQHIVNYAAAGELTITKHFCVEQSDCICVVVLLYCVYWLCQSVGSVVRVQLHDPHCTPVTLPITHRGCSWSCCISSIWHHVVPLLSGCLSFASCSAIIWSQCSLLVSYCCISTVTHC